MALILLFSPVGHGGQTRAIELRDGTVLVGEIVSAGQGAYTVESTRLGRITIADADIVAIRSPEAAGKVAPPASGSTSFAEGIAALQQQMLGNSQWMQSLQFLMDDPDVQYVLHDPELMKAVQSGNLQALQNNPKLNKLMANPTIQALRQQFQAGASQHSP